GCSRHDARPEIRRHECRRPPATCLSLAWAAPCSTANAGRPGWNTRSLFRRRRCPEQRGHPRQSTAPRERRRKVQATADEVVATWDFLAAGGAANLKPPQTIGSAPRAKPTTPVGSAVISGFRGIGTGWSLPLF